MKIWTDDKCLTYEQSGHPERPERVALTRERLRQQKEMPITWFEADSASNTSLLRAHTPEHLARLREPRAFDADTPFFPEIAERARAAAGATLAAMTAARDGEVAFSLMRPPGHHATRTEAMGFCYLSNIAIAALEALAGGVKRVAVFDFDVHHGNGTEEILIGQPGAAFFSVHQYPCYPGTGGRNRGENCFNYPVPPQTHRAQYRETLESALQQMKRFKPQLIGVSAGFDAYARDPLAQETLEAEDFYWLGQSLRQLDTPIFSVLEGGYSDDLPNLVLAYLKGIASPAG